MNLATDERTQLEEVLHRGTSKARVLTRARILLKSADGWSIDRIAQAFDVSPATVSNTRQRYQHGGVTRVLSDLPPKPHKRALDADGEAILLATACSPVPDGHDHWTLRLLRGRLITLGVVEGISAATIQATLKKMRLNPGGANIGACLSSMPRL